MGLQMTLRILRPLAFPTGTDLWLIPAYFTSMNAVTQLVFKVSDAKDGSTSRDRKAIGRVHVSELVNSHVPQQLMIIYRRITVLYVDWTWNRARLTVH